jgi:sarcosine oxidase subunit gamma
VLAAERPRVGLKGPAAAQWLAVMRVPVPATANSWLPLSAGGIVARLAWSEFLIEQDGDAPLVHGIREALAAEIAGVYPVLRSDTVLELRGEHAVEVLLQTCSVNFGDWPCGENRLALTSMVGVSVLVVPQVGAGAASFRIWCDPTFGPYLGRTLAEVAAETRSSPSRFTQESP